MSISFSYFAKYILKLEPKQTFDIKVSDSGSFLHDFLDKFSQLISNSVDKNGNKRELIADTVVVAIGNKPDAALYESLKDCVSELYNIGDSNGGGIIPNAVYDGYTVGNKI